MEMPVTVYFNPKCSKSRAARDLLDGRGIDYQLIEYLDAPLDLATLEDILQRLGNEDPRTILRSKEAVYRDLKLDEADRAALLTAIIQHPILLERPIVLAGTRGVVARPPERLLELFETE